MTRQIDLNADLGEGDAFDAEIMALISSCNIACGGHAGTAQSISDTLDLAKAHGVQPGAHPSYPDRDGFGRRSLEISLDALGEALTHQVATLADISARKDIRLTHLKPHGALYNEAAKDEALAGLLAVCTLALGPKTFLFGPPGSALEAAAKQAGLRFIGEGFVDRAYQPNGHLVPRAQNGAIIERLEARISQALAFAKYGEVSAVDGTRLALPVETLCLHGDSAGALETAKAISERFHREQITICAPS